MSVRPLCQRDVGASVYRAMVHTEGQLPNGTRVRVKVRVRVRVRVISIPGNGPHRRTVAKRYEG